MIRAPARSEIHATELRVARSGADTRDGVRRARVALRAALARPATVALAAGAAGLLGYWLARRPQRTASEVGMGVAKAASAAVLVRAFIMRYGMQGIPYILRQLAAARSHRAARAGSDS